MSDKIVADCIWINPERVSGAPCFLGTRLPIAMLFEWLDDGKSVDEFAVHWDVPREHVIGVLKAAEAGLTSQLDAA